MAKKLKLFVCKILTIVSLGSVDLPLEITSFAGMMTLFYIATNTSKCFNPTTGKGGLFRLYEDPIANLVVQLLSILQIAGPFR